MALWIFPKKIESTASISRKMMGVSSHTWIVIQFYDLRARFSPKTMAFQIGFGSSSPTKNHQIQGKLEIENHSDAMMKVGFPAGKNPLPSDFGSGASLPFSRIRQVSSPSWPGGG